MELEPTVLEVTGGMRERRVSTSPSKNHPFEGTCPYDTNIKFQSLATINHAPEPCL